MAVSNILRLVSRHSQINVRVAAPRISPYRFSDAFYSTGDENAKPLTESSSYSRKDGLLKRLFFRRFMRFVQGYETILETKFPRAFRVYQVFSIGIKEFYQDAKIYAKISREIMKGKPLHEHTFREIEKYYQMPKDIIKVAPVLLISVLPFANYVIFPIAYIFPRHLLSSHFWNLQQKLDFAIIAHKKKLHNYRPVFRHLQAKLENIKDEVLKKKWARILFKIGSGVHPTPEEIVGVRMLFSGEPYELNNLSVGHITNLCQMHGLSYVGFRRRRLWLHARIVQDMDWAIMDENPQCLTLDDLKRACFLRGLSPVGMHREDMIAWLQSWFVVIQNVESHSLSLLLHCPILLAYNHPSNWTLIH